MPETDALSEVLKTIKLDGALFFNAELSAPWCLVEPVGAKIAPYLSPGAGHLLLYHYVLSGDLEARLPDGPRVPLTTGDVVVMPHGDSHILSNGKPEKPADTLKVFSDNLARGLKLARYGGGGEITRLVCGYMVCEPRLGSAFLAGLPRLLKVRLSDDASGRWLADSIRFAVGEGPTGDGEKLVIAKLSEVVFVETLRRYMGSLPQDQVGWLAAARDPAVGQVLQLIHSEPANDWTVASLARHVGVSRTRLADRFRHFLDDTPMAYLAKWRLRLAAESLAATDRSIAEIAADVGYSAESSFNRAFKKQFDIPPAQYRRQTT